MAAGEAGDFELCENGQSQAVNCGEALSGWLLTLSDGKDARSVAVRPWMMSSSISINRS